MNIVLLDLLVVAVVGLSVWLKSRLDYRRRNYKRLPHPPGPKPIPVIGNVFDMPTSQEWVAVADMGKKYGGDVVFVENFGQPMLFLNTYEAAYELLEKRSSIYSDRPPFTMLTDPRLMHWHWSTPAMRYGERLRIYREYLHRFLQPAVVRNYWDIQTREAHRYVLSLLESPRKYENHTRRTAGAITLMIAYGHEVAPENDLFINLADKAAEGISAAAVPGAFLVDLLPFLKYVPVWFPGAGFKRKAKVWSQQLSDMVVIPYNMTKQKIRDGSAVPSVMSQLLESLTDKDGNVENEDIIAGSAAIVYGAGADTTVSSLLSFLLALVVYPDVQKRGQEEIDRVVGKDRLPTFADRERLPYVDAIMRETLRWNPVTPFGVPHSSMEDDYYNGCFIPAGTQVIPNQWAMLHDEKMYPDSSEFIPERWLREDGAGGPRHSDKIAFGWGRRLCPGKYVAEDSIFIGIATVLATLNLEKARDADGNPITPPVKYRPGFLSHPETFDFVLASRSSDVIELVHQAVDASGGMM